MEKYIALIRKDDFVDLFKYGSFHINRDLIRKFTCPVSELPQKECIFNDLVYFSNAFGNTFEYIFIIFRKGLNRVNDLNIADVLGVYPLDEEAKKEFSQTLDPRIVINDPLWPDAVFSLQKQHELNNFKAGISNVWKIYGLKDSIDSVRNYVPNEVFLEFIDEMYENRRPKGDIPILTYIMRYNRHAFYPKNTVGYFMDTVNVVFNYMQKREVDSSEIMGTMIMQFLQHCSDNLADKSFDNICKVLYNEPSVSKILEKIDEIEPNYNLLKAATLYYIFLGRYREGIKYEENYLKTGMKNGFEFSVACYLLGATLGHGHTYDCLYSELPLPIFTNYYYDQEGKVLNKSEEEKSIPHPTNISQTNDDSPLTGKQLTSFQQAPKSSLEIDKNDGNNDDLPEEKEFYSKERNKSGFNTLSSTPKAIQPSLFKDEGTPLDEPIEMKNGPRGRKRIRVTTQEQYMELLGQGFMQVMEKKYKTKRKSNKQ